MIEKRENMIPAGYMAKIVATKPDWLKTADVQDIYSVSDCILKPFTDDINYRKHNGFYFFNYPMVIQELTEKNS